MIVRDNECVDAVEEIVECNKAMRDTQKTTEDALYLTFLGALVDRETGAFTPSDRYPTGDCPFVLVSNVGVYRFVKNPRMFAAKVFRGANVAVYSYNNGKELEIMIIHPKGLDAALINATIAEMDEFLCKVAGSKRR